MKKLEKELAMNRSSKFVLFALIALAVFALFTSCQNVPGLVTPVAYTRFDGTGDQYIYYSSYKYFDQLVVWKNEAKSHEQFANPDLSFSFGECCGADNLEGKRYTLVKLSSCYFSVMIISEVYDSNKSIYLNGTALVPDSITTGDASTVLTFNNPPFVRTNPGGTIDKNKVNVLEYKY